MPREWRRVFCVSVGEQSFTWRTLPFGWKYSAVLCRQLMQALVGNAVADLLVLPFVYLDDVLVAGNRRELKRAMCRIKSQPGRAIFALSPKLELSPVVELDFIGKNLQHREHGDAQQERMISRLLRSWFKLVMGTLRRKGMEQFLGRLEWALWPQAGTAAFLAVTYKWKTE